MSYISQEEEGHKTAVALNISAQETAGRQTMHSPDGDQPSR